MDQIVAIKVLTASISCVDYNMETGEQTVVFSSYKPDVGLERAQDSGDDV